MFFLLMGLEGRWFESTTETVVSVSSVGRASKFRTSDFHPVFSKY